MDAPRPPGVRAYLLLAAPMVASRAGMAMMGLADGVMVARFDAHQYAGLSLAEGTLGRVLDVCIAFLIGALSLLPRTLARQDGSARRLWLAVLPVALGLGLAGVLAGQVGAGVLALLGQRADLIASAAPVMEVLGLGFPGALLALAAGLYLEANRRPHDVAVAILAANALNIALNWLLIGGQFGLPALGAVGSAWSTTLVRTVLAVCLLGRAWQRPWLARAPSAPPAAAGNAEAPELAAERRSQWRLGGSAALTAAVMIGLVSCLTLIAGHLGGPALATFAASSSLMLPGMLLALGLADAAGIEVSSASGHQGDAAAAATAWRCLRWTLLLLSPIAALLAFDATRLGQLYTPDALLRAGIGAALPWIALVLLADSAGFVMAAGLRALRDVAALTVIEVVSVLVLVPLAAVLALAQGQGVRGLLLAMSVVALARAGLLALRFRSRSLDRGLDRTATGLA